MQRVLSTFSSRMNRTDNKRTFGPDQYRNMISWLYHAMTETDVSFLSHKHTLAGAGKTNKNVVRSYWIC